MTKSDWQKQLANSPEDSELRLIYSDWLEDNGKIDEANAVRYYVNKRYQPCDCINRDRLGGWVWFRYISEVDCGWKDTAILNKTFKRNSIIEANLYEFIHSRIDFDEDMQTTPYDWGDILSLGGCNGCGFKYRQDAENALIKAILNTVILGEKANERGEKTENSR